jgi:hypothetical protein
LAVAWTALERRFVEVRLVGGTRADQAAALGVGPLPADERPAELNRTWDRLMRRLTRSLERRGGQ